MGVIVNVLVKPTSPGITKYRGRIIKVFSSRKFGFVGQNSIRYHSGPVARYLGYDLPLHINKNPRLGFPLTKGKWIIFSIDPSAETHFGLEVFDAEYC